MKTFAAAFLFAGSLALATGAGAQDIVSQSAPVITPGAADSLGLGALGGTAFVIPAVITLVGIAAIAASNKSSTTTTN